jgi:PadR family transcriptional regulator, regulatory protein PadR
MCCIVLKMYYFCSMNTEKNISQMRKGVLELCILAIIARSEEVYASDILDQLKEAKLIVVEGTLYPLLTRLKNEGLLSYRWEESRSGPPRKYYQITPMGDVLLKELVNGWQELVGAVDSLIKKQ